MAAAPTLLILTELREISDVPKGANPYADTKIVKSAKPGDTAVKLDEITKALAGLTEAERAEVAKAASATPDPLAGVPADVVKQLTAQAAEIAELRKAQAERTEAEGVAKCADEAVGFGVQTITKADGVLFHKADKAGFGADFRAFVAKVAGPLKAAETNLGKMAGSSVEASGAGAKLDALAKARAAASGEPYAKAYADVCMANPELFAANQRGE
jgi:hypothetical protein